MPGPFRDDHEAALRRIEQLEESNTDLRAALANAQATPSRPARRAVLLGLGIAVVAVGVVVRVNMRAAPPPTVVVYPQAPEMEHVSLLDVMESYKFPAKRDLHGAWSDGKETVVVGDDGEVAHANSAAPVVNRGNIWTEGQPTKQTLRAVAGDASSLCAVGDGGTILRRSRATQQWVAEESGVNVDLLGVAIVGRQLYAVGRKGTILRRAPWDTKWAVEESGTQEDLYALVPSSDAVGAFAFGDHGQALARKSQGWRPLPTGTTADLRGAASYGGDVFVVGKRGTILHASADHQEMIAEPSGTLRDLLAVAVREPLSGADADGIVIAVGQGGTVRVRKVRAGSAWAKQGVVTEEDLLAVWPSPTVVVGVRGTVLAARGFFLEPEEP